MSGLTNKEKRKRLTVVSGFFLMYVGFALFFLPFIKSSGLVELSENPQFFGFEDDLSSISSTYGSPEVVFSPFAREGKVVEVENRDYVRWDLPTPIKTLDLTFKISWTRLPVLDNESLIVGEIFSIDEDFWLTIFSSKLYTDRHSYSGWNLWTDLSGGYVSSVSGGFASVLETNRWYTIRMTADLNSGSFELYLDAIRLTSIENIEVSEDVFIDFFRLGTRKNGDGVFITYYDDISVSTLAPYPQPEQWSLSITSSLGGFTHPQGLVNLDADKELTVTANESADYVFSKWIFDGVDYCTSANLTVPAQSPGTRHTLHSLFINKNPEPVVNFGWVLIQLVGLVMIGTGGYFLLSNSKNSFEK